MAIEKQDLLPVTKAVIAQAQAANFRFESTAIVGVQHMLWQTPDLCRGLGRLGVEPTNIFMLGKVYSNGAEVIKTLRNEGISVPDSTMPHPGEFNQFLEMDVAHLWENVRRAIRNRNIKHILVLDDGGQCIKHMPPDLTQDYLIAGVEQTSSGILELEKHPSLFPVISWAKCAIKTYISSPIYSIAVIDELARVKGNDLLGQEIGIIGLGSIGMGMAEALIRQGSSVQFYDPSPNSIVPEHLQGKIGRSEKLEDLMLNSDTVIGCSGRNPFKDLWPLGYRPGVQLISASSSDQEFGPIIAELKDKSDFAIDPDTWDITVTGASGPVVIAYRGYPYNFVARSGESVPTQVMQLEIGGGLLASLIQAYSHLTTTQNSSQNSIGIHRFSAHAQRFILNAWLQDMTASNIDIQHHYGLSKNLLKTALDPLWLAAKSEPNRVGHHHSEHMMYEMMRHELPQPIQTMSDTGLSPSALDLAT